MRAVAGKLESSRRRSKPTFPRWLINPATLAEDSAVRGNQEARSRHIFFPGPLPIHDCAKYENFGLIHPAASHSSSTFTISDISQIFDVTQRPWLG
jgi:hypothetical protein